MSDAIAYTVRRSALEAERTWTVDDKGLSWTDPKRPGHFDFGEITEIRLHWQASRADLSRYTCHVRRFNGWTETIVSTHYDGPMQFPDRREHYVPFVTELVRRTAVANPRCIFRAGPSAFAYFGSLFIMLVGFGLLAMVILTIGIAFTWLILVKLAIIAFFLPFALRWLKVNRPRRFTPHDIPQGVLPALP